MATKRKLGADIQDGDIVIFVGGLIIEVYDNCGGFILGTVSGLPVKFGYLQTDTFPVVC